MTMRALFRSLPFALGLGALGCNETPVEVVLRSLQASSEVTFVCRGEDGEGRERADCPDFDEGKAGFYALVTQASTEEVAVVDASRATVVDVDPSVPGFSFLRVASRPGDIVSTPGGAASFVGLTGVGKHGIASIPTTCLSPPDEEKEQPGRDVTTFPSCSLPSVPGDLAVLIDPADANGVVYASCDRSLGAESTTPEATNRACAANLTTEAGPIGRRKLAISLPDYGEIVLIDAQWLLDRAPGSFEPCQIEATLPLSTSVGSGATQRPPEELVAESCPPVTPTLPPDQPNYASVPAGFSHEGDRLYVADRGAPLIHVIDAKNPCALAELPSLLPMSFEEPWRVVTTSKVAASPTTKNGKRFVYAIDELDQPAASVMAFDVSDDSTDRTPIVRPGSVRLPLEPPDRIRFGAPIADVAFALRDLPRADPTTGVAELGVPCDPDPRSDDDTAGVLYRPNSDFSSGARPRLLRGLFGFLMLSSGQVVVIDVDDFDAKCRRPTATNPTANLDFRGCAADDPELPGFLTLDESEEGTPTVTNEVSCRMVQPHRTRGSSLGVLNTSYGTAAPALRAFPQFSSADPTVQPAVDDRPKILAVDWPSPDPDGEPLRPEVVVGSTLYRPDTTGAELPMDPNTAVQNSLVLPWVEPRAYLPGDAYRLMYEGAIMGELPSGFVELSSDDAAGDWISDPNGYYCDRGVFDPALMSEYGADEFGLSGDSLDAFARSHSDYVQITGDFPNEDSHDYWSSERASACGSRDVCEDTFGPHDSDNLDPNRDFLIEEAYQDRLRVVPRHAESDEERARIMALAECCFPGGIQYTIRSANQWILTSSGTGFRHDVVARATATPDGVRYRCARDCNPKKTFFKSRAFEISSSDECAVEEGDPLCAVGRKRSTDPCVYSAADGGGVTLGGPGSACIFENLTSRFAVYRGLVRSSRGMQFNWQTSGGFSALAASIVSRQTAPSPQSLVYVPELQHIAVVDAATLGLSLISLDTLRLEDPWPVY
jgi:hypothetical protein